MGGNSEEKTIFEVYADYLDKYIREYGPKTIVMMQVGMFHEFYGVDNEYEKVGYVREISEILNIVMTRKNKNIAENNRKNYLMAGFPSVSIERYINILLENNYTVVVVDQTSLKGDSPNSRVDRAVTRICSPGTYIDECRKAENNFLTTIYFETEKTRSTGKYLLTVGLTAVDLSTGEIYLHEAYSNIEDTNYAIDETYRFIVAHAPREIVLHIDDSNLGNLTTNAGEPVTTDYLVEVLDLHKYVYHVKPKIPIDYHKINYQNAFLGKIYTGTQCGILSPIEYLELETRKLSTVSLLISLQFAYDHNEKIIQKLKKPDIWDQEGHLILANNAISQLGLVHNTNRSVLKIVDMTSTSMGKRLLKYRLLNPIMDTKQLSHRYGLVDEMLRTVDVQEPNHTTKNQITNYFRYEKYLSNMVDIERLHRKVGLKMLQPTEFNTLHASYLELQKLLDLIGEEPNGSELLKLLCSNLNQEFESMSNYYQKILDLDETHKYNLQTVTDSFFKVGYNQDLDKISYQIKHYNEFFRQLTSKISNMIVRNSDCVSLKFGEGGVGHYLNLTNKRYELLSDAWTESLEIIVDDQKYQVRLDDFRKEKVSTKSSSCNLFSAQIKTISDKLVSLQAEIKEKTVGLYLEFLEEFYQKHSQLLERLVVFVSRLDVAKSTAKASARYSYTRPQLEFSINNDNTITDNTTADNTTTKSYINAKGLRHPIIERINQSLIYVPHDISLGTEIDLETERVDGLLIYGVNSSGKSSLMKSVGINLVMAQAGLYVAANQFRYRPYQYILTRIIGNDDIFKGLSSFAVEMSELRGILKRATPRSLVLGDEICHGTETVSGVAIVAAAIQYLAKRQSSFIFATHLHQLANMTEIQELNNVKNFHLRVFYDQKTGKLVYDRNLMTGSGDPIYGLEVARAMQLDQDFLEKANQIRKKMLEVSPEILSTKKSHFNRKIYIDRCQVCDQKAEEVHHIGFQCTADDRGMIGHYNKNIQANLVPLCHNCHLRVHDRADPKLTINGYLLSDQGIKLDFKDELIINH